MQIYVRLCTNLDALAILCKWSCDKLHQQLSRFSSHWLTGKHGQRRVSRCCTLFTPSESHLLTCLRTVRYTTLYDAFLFVASQAMVRFVSFWIIITMFKYVAPGFPGHIAKLIGMPNYSRHVGQGEETFPHLSVWLFYQKSYGSALKFLPSNTNPPIPWHRVIGASGSISSRGPGTSGAQRQHDALQAEGVEVTTGRNGEMRVNLREFGWFPSIAELNPVQNSDDDDNDVPETQPW